MIRKWDTDNKDLIQKCVNEVIARIQDLDDPATVGIVAAQDIIDIVLDNMGPEIYNKSLKDVSKLLNERYQEIEYSIDELRQS